jgi:DNA repair exonuclease SbcCD ATPase subunit
MVVLLPLFGKKEKKEESPAAEEPKKEIKWDEAPAPGEDDAGRLGLASEEQVTEEEVGRKEEAVPGVEELLLRVEKIHGRLEALDQEKARSDERIARLSEQVGELRTMGLEREKSMGLLEADFELIKNVFEEVKPSEVARELERKEKSITEVRVKAEKMETLLERFGDEVRTYREMMEKIKGMENLIEMQRTIKEETAKSDDTKKYIDRLAAKVESIFAELSSKLLALDEYQAKVEVTDELTKELVKSVDELGIKLKNFVSSEEVAGFIKKADLEAFSKKIDDKVSETEKNLRSLQEEIRGSFKSAEKEKAEINEKIKKIEGRIEIPSDEIWAAIDELRKGIRSLIERKPLDELIKEREKVAKEGNEERLAIIDSQIDELRHIGRLARIVEEHDDAIRKVLRASLVDEDTLRHLREKIIKEDIGEVKKSLEERIKKVEVPSELRKSIEKEVSREIKDILGEELKKAEILLSKKIEGADRLKTAMEEKVDTAMGQTESRIASVLESQEGVRAQFSALEDRYSGLSASLSKQANFIEEFTKSLDAVRKDIARSRAQTKSTEELTREKESILSMLDTLKIKYEESMISKDSYEAALKENVERLTELDAKIEEQSRMETILKTVEVSDARVRELADICNSFISRDDLDDFREKVIKEEMEKIKSSIEGTLREIPKETEAKINEQKIAMQKVADLTKTFIDEERAKNMFAGMRREDSKRIEEIVNNRIDRVIRDIARTGDTKREELEKVREDLERRMERLPSEFDTKINEQELEIEELKKLNSLLEKQIEALQKSIADVSMRMQRKSLGELVREREKIMSSLDSSRSNERDRAY